MREVKATPSILSSILSFLAESKIQVRRGKIKMKRGYNRTELELIANLKILILPFSNQNKNWD